MMKTIHLCLRYVRSEKMKEIRRRIGDRGGIKFQGKVPSAREDGCTNTLTNVLKDNLIMKQQAENAIPLYDEPRFKQPSPPLEIPTESEFSEIELTPDSVVEPLGDCRFRIDGRVLRFAIRKLTETECFRLMDVDDADIKKIQAAGISRSQQYKLAGNSVVISCFYHLFRKMFIETEPEYKRGDILSLF